MANIQSLYLQLLLFFLSFISHIQSHAFELGPVLPPAADLSKVVDVNNVKGLSRRRLRARCPASVEGTVGCSVEVNLNTDNDQDLSFEGVSNDLTIDTTEESNTQDIDAVVTDDTVQKERRDESSNPSPQPQNSDGTDDNQTQTQTPSSQDSSSETSDSQAQNSSPSKDDNGSNAVTTNQDNTSNGATQDSSSGQSDDDQSGQNTVTPVDGSNSQDSTPSSTDSSTGQSNNDGSDQNTVTPVDGSDNSDDNQTKDSDTDSSDSDNSDNDQADQGDGSQSIDDSSTDDSNDSGPGPVAADGLTPGWSYRYCATDSQFQRALDHQAPNNWAPAREQWVNEECVQYCDDNGWQIAGTEWKGQCWCGNQINDPSMQVSEDECNETCFRDESEECGSDNRLSLYAKDGAEVPSSSVGQSLHYSTTTTMDASTATPSSTPGADYPEPPVRDYQDAQPAYQVDSEYAEHNNQVVSVETQDGDMSYEYQYHILDNRDANGDEINLPDDWTAREYAINSMYDCLQLCSEWNVYNGGNVACQAAVFYPGSNSTGNGDGGSDSDADSGSETDSQDQDQASDNSDSGDDSDDQGECYLLNDLTRLDTTGKYSYHADGGILGLVLRSPSYPTPDESEAEDESDYISTTTSSNPYDMVMTSTSSSSSYYSVETIYPTGGGDMRPTVKIYVSSCPTPTTYVGYY